MDKFNFQKPQLYLILFYILARAVLTHNKSPIKENNLKDKPNVPIVKDAIYLMDCANLEPPAYLLPVETTSAMNSGSFGTISIEDISFLQANIVLKNGMKI